LDKISIFCDTVENPILLFGTGQVEVERGKRVAGQEKGVRVRVWVDEECCIIRSDCNVIKLWRDALSVGINNGY
jgi:hypothetical protein